MTETLATVESVMSIAFELARIREQHGAQSGMYLSEVRALRAEVERLAAQAAPTADRWHDATLPPEIEQRLAPWLTNGAALHPATVNLVVRFARALSKKLAAAETKYGYSDGWLSPDWMDECRSKLMEHIAKGDPRDVAAYCAFLWHHGASTAVAQPSQAPVVQAGEYPPLPEGVKARFKCEDCDGTGYTGEMIPGSEFQPPEPVGCTSCRFTGWWAECEAYSADQMHAYLDADRASSGATTQAVRMLTEYEQAAIIDMHSTGRAQGDHECAEAIQRKFCEVNNLRIPADGKIGDAA